MEASASNKQGGSPNVRQVILKRKGDSTMVQISTRKLHVQQARKLKINKQKGWRLSGKGLNYQGDRRVNRKQPEVQQSTTIEV